MSRLQRFADQISRRKADGLYRQHPAIDSYQGRLLHNKQGAYVNFSGNDYLGLATEPQLIKSLAEGAERFGVGSSGSPLVTGFHYAHRALSDELCDWLGVDDVLLFSSGFAANQVMLQHLTDKTDQLLLDKLCHASLIDAALHADAGYKRFPHQDLAALDILLQPYPAALVVTEGVFSMDGDSPDLSAISALCKKNNADLLLDDAHALGVLGTEGRGSWDAQGLEPGDMLCLMANFGKALAGQGAFLAGSATMIDYLRQFARHYIYSTALSPALCWAMKTSVELSRSQEWRRDKLNDNIQLFKTLAAGAGFSLLPSNTAIQPLIIGDSDKAMLMSASLKKQGIWLSAIRPPTVPQGSARLRITLSALHQSDDIRSLVQKLEQLI
ncbi:MAG: 8-amino-7-oxononanoate synthase [Gammaproteobacteria bacterium]|nr:8-amino-7-oxononanoate synthase [Gammaproteobacteria bacterium]MBU2057886.1 8-amino-7-oxononanoate synthase [Gammaproteobacteria bacterium]MBU2176679.1 8-amino-7-oxononanoate synthase [Gammaproteobacteria bacterium]MBU2247812.1 8-amino-7-oxononanoate synthase [Gammaproteobacteria bacterium]MBU2344337.1 8-amino-7-oxononanoate synthase [Gammaproteobacteria bacterium]